MKFTMSSVVAVVAVLGCGTAPAAGVPGQGTWETTLLPRDINKDGEVDAFYDTDLSVTWLANASAPAGLMHWDAAMAWVAGLDVHGVTGWRLPRTIGPEFAQDGELKHMYFVTQGNTTEPWVPKNPGPFSNWSTLTYWYGQEWSGDPAEAAWTFNNNEGFQSFVNKNSSILAWAVRDGDVAGVPEPMTFALMSLGLFALRLSVHQQRRWRAGRQRTG